MIHQPLTQHEKMAQWAVICLPNAHSLYTISRIPPCHVILLCSLRNPQEKEVPMNNDIRIPDTKHNSNIPCPRTTTQIAHSKPCRRSFLKCHKF